MNPNRIILDFVTPCVTVDPVGAGPLFLALAAALSEADRRRVAVRAILISPGLLLASVAVNMVFKAFVNSGL